MGSGNHGSLKTDGRRAICRVPYMNECLRGTDYQRWGRLHLSIIEHKTAKIGKNNLLSGIGTSKPKLKRDESSISGFSLPTSEVQTEFEASNGVTKTSMRENIVAGWDQVKRRGTRTFEWLPAGARFSKLKNALLLLRKEKRYRSS